MIRTGVAAVLALGCAVALAAPTPVAPPPPSPAPASAPPSDVALALPRDWRPLPAVADAGLTAAHAAAGGRLTEVRSWGDPGLGCFASVVEVTGTRDEKLADVARTLQLTLDAAVELDDWRFTDGPVAEVGATIARRSLRGAIRGKLATAATGEPRAVVATCFYNAREPARCQATCAAVLASLEPPRISP